MAKTKASKYWIDQVLEKHECYPYRDTKTVSVLHNGVMIELVVPDYLPEFSILNTAESDGMLYCFGRTEQEHNGGFIDCLIVAKRCDEGRYEAGIWHELFPYALKHFGFEKE